MTVIAVRDGVHRVTQGSNGAQLGDRAIGADFKRGYDTSRGRPSGRVDAVEDVVRLGQPGWKRAAVVGSGDGLQAGLVQFEGREFARRLPLDRIGCHVQQRRLSSTGRRAGELEAGQERGDNAGRCPHGADQCQK